LTVIVAVRCSDGVVVGADDVTLLTVGDFPIVRVPTKKLAVIENAVLVATAGDVGLRQRFEYLVEQAYGEGKFNGSWIKAAEYIAETAVKAFKRTGARNKNKGYDLSALMAAPFHGRHELIEFADGNLQPLKKTDEVHFASLGIGQHLADPFLAFISRVLWKGQAPTVRIGTIGVLWALTHAYHCAPTGVGEPGRLGVLSKKDSSWSAEIFDYSDLSEQTQHVRAIESGLPDFALQITERTGVAPPPTPPPDVPPADSISCNRQNTQFLRWRHLRPQARSCKLAAERMGERFGTKSLSP
jgi:hypothetical protein